MSRSEQLEHRARKRFGQNFLEDSGVISAIGNAISPQPNDHIVEIGPGLGALTSELIGRAKQLTLIELDRDLLPKLEQKFNHQDAWSILSADALEVDFSELAGSSQIRVVGNLPYNISTPLIFHLLEYAERIKDMHFMLQKEVVLRLTAKPGTGAWGRLSLMVQYFCETEFLLEVPPEAFNPAPKVVSAVVRLTPRTPPYPAKDLNQLELVIKTAFAQRRKTLRNTLKSMFNTEQLIELGIDPGARAETLSLEQYVNLSNSLEP
jgi:16S rRNA (adenine1518-N6/adenine1519-N6)-dimethyltransferase